jgi:hypothetical protein
MILQIGLGLTKVQEQDLNFYLNNQNIANLNRYSTSSAQMVFISI